MFCHLVFDIALPTPQTFTDLINYDYMVGEGSCDIEIFVVVSEITCYTILNFLCFVIECYCSPSL